MGDADADHKQKEINIKREIASCYNRFVFTLKASSREVSGYFVHCLIKLKIITPSFLILNEC